MFHLLHSILLYIQSIITLYCIVLIVYTPKDARYICIETLLLDFFLLTMHCTYLEQIRKRFSGHMLLFITRVCFFAFIALQENHNFDL